MKKIGAYLCAVLLMSITLLSFSPATALASSNNEHLVITVETENPDIALEIYRSETVYDRGYSTVTRSHSGRFYLKSTGATLANIKLTGKFSYDGTLCNVTSSVGNVTNVEDGWRVTKTTSKTQVSPTLAKAVGEFYLYKESSNTLSSSATITIYCNQNGNTSSQFNGDE